MKKVFLYAGQGSQKVGMGKDFYETYDSFRSFWDELSLPFDFKKLMMEGPLTELSRTEYTQGCMAAFAAGITKLLAEHGVTPEAACGLSLGEYGALYAAGVFSAEEYLRIVAIRGRVMAEAAKDCHCIMSAVIGTKAEVVEKACEQYSGDAFVTVANYNCPGQYVLCGDEEAVVAVEEILKGEGVRRFVHLNVSGPFHTKYMKPAGECLEKLFAGITFEKPKLPVAMNVTGSFYEGGETIPELLVRQVQSSVRLEEDLRTLLASGYTDFLEIGPGKAVSGFLKKTAKDMGIEVTVDVIETVGDFKRVIGEEA